MTYKTKYIIALSLLNGLKLDLENRLELCNECNFTLEYIRNAINILKVDDND